MRIVNAKGNRELSIDVTKFNDLETKTKVNYEIVKHFTFDTSGPEKTSITAPNAFNDGNHVQILKSALLLLFLFSAGCTTVNPDGTTSRHYFGYVKVIIPDIKGNVSAVDITTVGLRIAKGIGLGYLHDFQLAVPLDCRVVVIVKNKNQLDHTVKMLSKMEDNLCVAVQP